MLSVFTLRTRATSTRQRQQWRGDVVADVLRLLLCMILLTTTASQDDQVRYLLLGVSGTLQDGFELRHRLDYIPNSDGDANDPAVPAVWVGTGLVRGYKAYLDIKPPGWREYQAPPGPPRVPNPVIIPTGCYHDANVYHVYAVAPAQVMQILAGEPRFLSITPDTGLVDLTATETSDSLRRLVAQEQEKQRGHSFENDDGDDDDDNSTASARMAVALPLVTGVWFDATSLVPAPPVRVPSSTSDDDGTRVTNFAESLAAWAGVASVGAADAWEQVYRRVREAEQETVVTEYPRMCHPHNDNEKDPESVRFGVSRHHLRLNYPLTRQDLMDAGILTSSKDDNGHEEL